MKNEKIGVRNVAMAGLTIFSFLALCAPSRAEAQKHNVTVVLEAEPYTLDGCNLASSLTGRVLKQNVVETLATLDPSSGSLSPRLATSWEQVDPKTWRFKLREGVKFHDGASFDAQSVVQAIDRTFQAGLACETRSKFGGLKITGKAIDPLTLEITANNPEPILPVRMSLVGITSPKTPIDKLTVAPVGTGPYLLDHFAPGKEIVLMQNPNYWGKKPMVETATYVVRSKSAIRAAMVKIGEADLAPNIGVQDASDPKLDFSYLNSETTRLRLDVMTPPLNDKRVRLALNYAVDRNAIRGTILSDKILLATQMVVPSMSGHNHEIDKHIRPYDPAKAKQLLAEAKADGVPVDTQLILICKPNHWTNAAETMESLLGYFVAAGFNVKMRCIENAEHSAMQNKPFSPDRGPVMFQDQHDNNNGDPTFTVYSKYTCNGQQSTLCDEEVDLLEKKASALPMGPERYEVFSKIFQRVYEDIVADVPLFHMVGFTRVGERINFKPSISTNIEVPLETITFK